MCDDDDPSEWMDGSIPIDYERQTLRRVQLPGSFAIWRFGLVFITKLKMLRAECHTLTHSAEGGVEAYSSFRDLRCSSVGEVEASDHACMLILVS